MNSIKVYGSGCPSCIKLEQMSREAVEELGLDFSVEKVMDF
ncbi:MAG: thioredoxin family protein [Ignavibacteriaceae bacterium]